MPSAVTRRQALIIGVAGALTAPVVLAACTGAPARTRRIGPTDLPQPPVLKSVNGVLRVRLAATEASADIGVGRRITSYNYDGMIPGSTWEIDAGDLLAVELVNRMPRLDHAPQAHHDAGTDMTRPHRWTTTNLHTHGLHVSPEGNGDNPFIAVEPGARQRYAIGVPRTHQPGLFWYHPHHHGGVTQQVRGGMAGAIIVRGDLDRVPEIAVAAEKVMVLQAIELDANFTLAAPIADPTTEEAFFPRSQIFWTINGTYQPRITMYPGEIQRWRIVNAAEGKFASLRLAGHALHAIAWDGLTLARPEPIQDALMSPGNRVEVLVEARAAGSYDLVLSPGSSQKPTPDPGGTISPELVPRVIATVEVRGDGPAMRMPSALPAWTPPMLPVVAAREVAFTVRRTSNRAFVSFGVDGRPFSPAHAPYRMKLGTAEEWTVVNRAGFAHVFHIHVNPFLVTQINGQRLATPLWRDTFVLTRSIGDSFTFVTNLSDFTGRFVQHCHVLSHEDLGMMEAVEIVA